MENDKDGTAGKAPDMDSIAQSLSLSDSLREPVIRSAIQALQLPLRSRGLDAGCGIGKR
jgi:demethylmenaquinone methyltransferase/2-methoxy-6-polyprenyl-1,4-benzoquinol methylase